MSKIIYYQVEETLVVLLYNGLEGKSVKVTDCTQESTPSQLLDTSVLFSNMLLSHNSGLVTIYLEPADEDDILHSSELLQFTSVSLEATDNTCIDSVEIDDTFILNKESLTVVNITFSDETVFIHFHNKYKEEVIMSLAQYLFYFLDTEEILQTIEE